MPRIGLLPTGLQRMSMCVQHIFSTLQKLTWSQVQGDRLQAVSCQVFHIEDLPLVFYKSNKRTSVHPSQTAVLVGTETWALPHDCITGAVQNKPIPLKNSHVHRQTIHTQFFSSTNSDSSSF